MLFLNTFFVYACVAFGTFYYVNMMSSNKILIATVNCQGLVTPSKRKDVLNYYKQKHYSIICLQDTHFISEHEQLIETQWGYKCF